MTIQTKYSSLILSILFVFHSIILNAVDTDAIVGKVIGGYQGWFNCYNDGSPVDSWRHWAIGQYQSNTPNPSPNYLTFEIYPDISIYPASVLHQTGFANFPDGRAAELFSSYPEATIDKHFELMAQHNIDGAALQRFVHETFDPAFKAQRDSITARVKRSAERHDRGFYMMYDLTGLQANEINAVKTDWTNVMNNQLNITASNAYFHENNKPVVCIWGPGFSHLPHSAAQSQDLVNWFKAQGCFVIGGVPTYWRDGINDSKPGFAGVYQSFDMISPWSPGRITNLAEVDLFKNNVLLPDLNYCNQNNIDYFPVVSPGFSWSNLTGGPVNQIPRLQGEYYWRQIYNIASLNIPSLYIAMFDEYDEGTAIAPSSDSYLIQPSDQFFLTSSADGKYISSDFYLRLTDEANQMISNQIPVSATFSTPFSVGPIFIRTSVEPGYCAQPDWTNTVEQTTAITNVSGTGPNNTPVCELTTAFAFSGGYGLKLEGVDNESVLPSHCYFKVFDVDIPVESATWLSFKTYPVNQLSRSTNVDLIFTDGSTLRDSGAENADGVSMHPGAGHGIVGQWSETISNIGCWVNGKTIDRIVVAYDNSPGTGNFTTYFDDIVVYNDQASSNCTGFIQPQICLWLEAAYLPTDIMSTNLLNLGLLPSGQSYNQPPWNYFGTEGQGWTTADYPANAVDWVLVSFRTGTGSETEVARAAAVLQSNGCLFFPESEFLNENMGTAFFIVIEHRNHMAAMTPTAIPVNQLSISFDFRVGNSFLGSTGSGQKQIKPGVWALFAGDGEQVQDVGGYDINSLDNIFWQQKNGTFSDYLIQDFNLDGDVNGQDRIFWSYNNGIFSNVPK